MRTIQYEGGSIGFILLLAKYITKEQIAHLQTCTKHSLVDAAADGELDEEFAKLNLKVIIWL